MFVYVNLFELICYSGDGQSPFVRLGSFIRKTTREYFLLRAVNRFTFVHILLTGLLLALLISLNE